MVRLVCENARAGGAGARGTGLTVDSAGDPGQCPTAAWEKNLNSFRASEIAKC